MDIYELQKEGKKLEKEIKNAYHILALKWHPDRNKTGKEQATKKFTKINDAYEKIIENMRVEECTP